MAVEKNQKQLGTEGFDVGLKVRQRSEAFRWDDRRICHGGKIACSVDPSRWRSTGTPSFSRADQEFTAVKWL
jgi:hypothetical protein